MSLANRLKEERARVGHTQVSLAKALEISHRSLQEWERGPVAPNAATLASMASAGIDVAYVLTGARGSSVDAELIARAGRASVGQSQEVLEAFAQGVRKQALQQLANLMEACDDEAVELLVRLATRFAVTPKKG